MYVSTLTYVDRIAPKEVRTEEFRHEDRHSCVRQAIDHVKEFGQEFRPFRIDTRHTEGWSDPTTAEPEVEGAAYAEDQA